MDDSSILLINLKTGNTINADYYALRERGLPEGYVVARDLTTAQWVEALQNALHMDSANEGRA